jgi:hypothetical protein
MWPPAKAMSTTPSVQSDGRQVIAAHERFRSPRAIRTLPKICWTAGPATVSALFRSGHGFTKLARQGQGKQTQRVETAGSDPAPPRPPDSNDDLARVPDTQFGADLQGMRSSLPTVVTIVRRCRNLAANTSAFFRSGGSASSSEALAIKADVSCPLRCASRPTSSGKASKIANVSESNRIGNRAALLRLSPRRSSGIGPPALLCPIAISKSRRELSSTCLTRSS